MVLIESECEICGVHGPLNENIKSAVYRHSIFIEITLEVNWAYDEDSSAKNTKKTTATKTIKMAADFPAKTPRQQRNLVHNRRRRERRKAAREQRSASRLIVVPPSTPDKPRSTSTPIIIISPGDTIVEAGPQLPMETPGTPPAVGPPMPPGDTWPEDEPHPGLTWSTALRKQDRFGIHSYEVGDTVGSDLEVLRIIIPRSTDKVMVAAEIGITSTTGDHTIGYAVEMYEGHDLIAAQVIVSRRHVRVLLAGLYPHRDFPRRHHRDHVYQDG